MYICSYCLFITVILSKLIHYLFGKFVTPNQCHVVRPSYKKNKKKPGNDIVRILADPHNYVKVNKISDNLTFLWHFEVVKCHVVQPKNLMITLKNVSGVSKILYYYYLFEGYTTWHFSETLKMISSFSKPYKININTKSTF